MPQPVEDSNFIESTSEVFQPTVEDDDPEQYIGEEVDDPLDEEDE